MSFKKRIYYLFCYLGLPIAYALGIVVALLARCQVRGQPRLVWGEAPIINNMYWARAMRAAGYSSETYTDEYCATLNAREEYDRVMQDHYRLLPVFLRYYPAFAESLFRYDVFFISFNGFFLGKTPYWWLENHFLRLAKKKVVVIPFGLDGYVYQRVRSTALLQGLLMSVPAPARYQAELARKVDYWCRHADIVIPGFMGPDGYGRWDVLVSSPLAIDEKLWRPSQRNSPANGEPGVPVVIAHAPNHQGFKGSEFVVDAVRQLKEEGLNVELLLIEKVPNKKVRELLHTKTDILVEQLIFTGHGLNGLEGMASGLTVISNLEDPQYILPLRRWSYFNECPIVSASPESLTDTLRQLVRRPDLRHQLGQAGRAYVEKFNSFDATVELFTAVIQSIYGQRGPLLHFCHPLLGEFRRHIPQVQTGLINGRIPT